MWCGVISCIYSSIVIYYLPNVRRLLSVRTAHCVLGLRTRHCKRWPMHAQGLQLSLCFMRVLAEIASPNSRSEQQGWEVCTQPHAHHIAPAYCKPAAQAGRTVSCQCLVRHCGHSAWHRYLVFDATVMYLYVSCTLDWCLWLYKLTTPSCRA